MLESTSIEARRLNITDDRQGSSLEHVISIMNSNSGQVRTTHFFQHSGTNGMNGYLVGGAITILKNMSSSMGRIIPYITENKSHV